MEGVQVVRVICKNITDIRCAHDITVLLLITKESRFGASTIFCICQLITIWLEPVMRCIPFFYYCAFVTYKVIMSKLQVYSTF